MQDNQQQQGRQYQIKIESSGSGIGGSDRIPRIPRDQSTSAVAACPVNSNPSPIRACVAELRGATGMTVGLPPLPPVVEFSAAYPDERGDAKKRSLGEKTPANDTMGGLPVVDQKNAASIDCNPLILSTSVVHARSDDASSAAMPELTVAVATEALAKGTFPVKEEQGHLEIQLQQFVSQKLATGDLDEAGMCALDALAKLKKGPSSKKELALENRLQQFVSQKLATGDLDKAGMCALDALAKMKVVQPTAHVSATIGTGKKTSSREQKGHHSTPPGVRDVPKFSGKDRSVINLKQTLTGFAQCVNVGLNRPGITTEQINTALLRDVHLVLEGPALEWFRLLMKGRVQWDATPPPDADTDDVSAVPSPSTETEKVVPPTTWKEVCNSLEDQFVPAEGISRTCAALLSIRQAPGESIRTYVGRQMGLNHQLSRLMERHGSGVAVWEVLQMGLFEKGLTPHLQRAQHAEPACNSFTECVARAEANDAALSASRTKAIEAAAAADNGKDACAVKAEPTAGKRRGESRTRSDDTASKRELPADSNSSANNGPSISDDIVSKGKLPAKSNSSTNEPVMASEKTGLQQAVERASSRAPSYDKSNEREREDEPKSTQHAAPLPSKRKREESSPRSCRGSRRSSSIARAQQNRPNRRSRNEGNEQVVPCEMTGCRNPHNHTTDLCFWHPRHGVKNRKQYNERRSKQKTERGTREWGSQQKENTDADHYHGIQM